METPANKELWCTACHEAGHVAVRAFPRLGWSDVWGASIVPDGDSEARVSGGGELLFTGSDNSESYAYIAMRVEVMALFAGPWAGIRAGGLSRRSWRDFVGVGDGAGADLPEAKSYVYGLSGGDDRMAESILDDGDTWAREMTRIPKVTASR